ncbi:MAG: hypothetical protein EXS16_19570 [Gemmataceae bacterium]|nr:hypothetical protein [Gemmataceae bacterium]
MTRMTKEFSLVLLGSGLLTTGYFLWPEDNLDKKANEQAAQQAGGARYRHRGFIPIFITTPRFAGAPMTSSSVSRSGFGTTGRGFSGIS